MDRLMVIGVGSLYAMEREGRLAPGGVAVEAALAATARAAVGVPVARVGMDRLGRDLVEALRAAGLDVASMQTDPDLPTARRTRRGGSDRLEPYASFDTLQFDSDLEGVGRTADVIVTDACSRRHGLSRSSIDRLMIGAPNAIRVIDCVARNPADPDRLEREALGNALELCQLFIVDAIALRAIAPSESAPAAAARRAASMTRGGTIVLVAQEGGALVATSRGTTTCAGLTAAMSSTEIAVAAGLAAARGFELDRFAAP